MKGIREKKEIKGIRGKKGSTAVFLSIILSSLIMLSMAMIWSAREHTVNSRTDAVINLAGDSLMSEFHKEIYTGYGLFMIGSDEKRLTSGLRNYMSPTLRAMKDVTISDVKADGSRRAIVDPEPVRQQIISYMKSGGADMITGKDKSPARSRGYHNLRHGPTIVSLPSRQLPEQDLISLLGTTNHLSDISGVFKKGTDRFLLGSYVLGTFNNCCGIAEPNHFFHNEVEYILCGKLTDEENEKAIVNILKALRFPSNLAHILSDSGKMTALATTSETIAPGPLAIPLQAALTAAWAYAESYNDAALLLEGSKVPIMKTETSWALGIESMLDSLIDGITDPKRYITVPPPAPDGEGETAGREDSVDPGSAPGREEEISRELGEYEEDPEKMLKKSRPVVHPVEESGLSYEQYLRILLFLREDPTTVMRILDLIQINVRKDYDGEFLIGEQSTGISTEVKVNERTHLMDKSY